jgi:uncharacterized protein
MSTPPPTQGRNSTLASVAHLSAFVALVGIPSFLGPLVVLLVTRDDPFATDQAKEALNFNLSILLYAIGAGLLAVVTLGLGLLLVVPVAIVAAVGWLVLVIVAAVRAGEGTPYRYPLTLRLVR